VLERAPDAGVDDHDCELGRQRDELVLERRRVEEERVTGAPEERRRLVEDAARNADRAELGALAGGGDAELLGDFGDRIGLAFQLLDDVLDVSGPAERTGKHRGTDLLDGTVTLPLILARERDPALAALDLRSVRTPEQAENVCDAIAAAGALETAREAALAIVADAKAQLPALPETSQQAALELVADGVVDRYA
jgi:geranylgeranyl pyrophosphate synthase